MNTPKKQHHVSKMLLRRFADRDGWLLAEREGFEPSMGY